MLIIPHRGFKYRNFVYGKIFIFLLSAFTEYYELNNYMVFEHFKIWDDCKTNKDTYINFTSILWLDVAKLRRPAYNTFNNLGLIE